MALIGSDGSGKTTVAHELVASFPLPMKYLYMGTSIESSNVALPTTRLIHWLKVQQYKRFLKKSGAAVPAKVSLHTLEHRTLERGNFTLLARLVSRVLEESFRQVVSWIYRLRGYVVLYDRHFLFDCCPVPSARGSRPFADRLHFWFLEHVYPRPDLVVFLSAPAEVLYTRKQEVPQDYLAREQKRLETNLVFASDFVTVDAARPLEEVVEVVKAAVLRRFEKDVGD